MSFTIETLKELREKTGAGMMDCKKALTESNGDMEEAINRLRKKGQIVAAKKSSRETKEGAVGIYSDKGGTKTALVKLNCETDFVSRNDNFKQLLDKFGGYLLESDGKDLINYKTPEGDINHILTNAVTALGENLVLEAYHLHHHAANSVIGTYVHSNSKIGCLIDIHSSAGAKPEIVELAKDLSMQTAAFQVEAINTQALPKEIIDKERAFLLEQAKESGKPADIAEKMVEGRINKFKKEIVLLEQAFVKIPDITVKQHVENISKQTNSKLEVVHYIKFTV